MIFKKLDIFTIKSFIWPFMATFFIVMFALTLQFLWLYIDELVGKGLGLGVILEFLGWGSLMVIPLAFPLATLLASIMTMGNMGESNELLAIKAAGIPLQRVMLPLIIVTCFITVSAFFATNNIIPLSHNKILTLRNDISKTKSEINIPKGVFYNGIDGYSLRIDDRNKETGMMYNVLVYDHTSRKGNVNMAVADSGLIRFAADGMTLLFTMYNGVSYDETNVKQRGDTTFTLQSVAFNEQEMIIPLDNYLFERSDTMRYGEQIRSQDITQLAYYRDSLQKKYDAVQLAHKTNFPYTAMLYSYQLDTAKNKNMVNVLPFDSLYLWKSSQEKLLAIQQAGKKAQLSINSLNSYEQELENYAYLLRRTILEYFIKFATAFACFIFFFIGAPVGAIIRKGGFGMPVIIAILFFVLYWVVDISAQKLARDGVISPFMGAFTSAFVLLPIGIFLTWKSTKDSSLFNTDAYLNSIKKFFKKIRLK